MRSILNLVRALDHLPSPRPAPRDEVLAAVLRELGIAEHARLVTSIYAMTLEQYWACVEPVVRPRLRDAYARASEIRS